MRDICGLTSTAVVADAELSDRFREIARGRDMTAVTDASQQGRRKYRMTTAGKQKLSANLADVTPEQSRQALESARTPEAQAKRSATLRENWAEAPVEAKRAVADRLRRTPQELSAQATARWDATGRQPCGTRASYRRGCRCDECRAAYLAYRKAHG